jgi:hypothetical protein
MLLKWEYISIMLIQKGFLIYRDKNLDLKRERWKIGREHYNSYYQNTTPCSASLSNRMIAVSELVIT